MALSRFASRAGLAAIGVFIAGAPAQAQTARIFVSAKSGHDSAICGASTAPCRTFLQAHTNTAPGGEIAVMDPGDYGPVSITKPLRIVNEDAGAAGVFQDVIGGNTGIFVNAGAGSKVALRGLTIEGKGTGATHPGVTLVSGDLRVERCTIRRMDRGVTIEAASPLNFAIIDSIFTDNVNDGVFVTATGAVGAVTGVIDHIVSTGHGQTGVTVTGSFAASPTTINVTVANSLMAFNGVAGLQAISTTGVPVRVTARDVVSASNRTFNGRGFWAFGTAATLRLAHSVAHANETGFANDAGTVETFQDNNIRGNFSAAVSGPLTNVVNQ